MRTLRLALTAVLGSLLLTGGAVRAADEAPAEPAERFKTAEVTGTVVAYTSRSLSLELNRDKGAINEVLLPVDPAVTEFDRMTGIKELQRGDKVRVAYRQTYRKNDAGEWILKTAVATKIARLGQSLDSPRLKSGADGGGP